MDAAKNFAKGTLSTGYDDAATSIVLVTGDGAKFPAAPFNAVWWNATDFADPADDPSVEIIRVTAKSTDTLTVERGHEGTGTPGVAGFTHEQEGKVYRLIAPLTARVINEQILPAQRTGDNYLAELPGALTIETDGSLIQNATTAIRLSASGPGMVMDISGTVAGLGDVDENNSGAAVLVDDSEGQVGLRGKVGTNQTAAATTLGSVTKKLEVFDLSGNSLGFIPLYGSIT